jgi:hypothetical protein
MKTRPQWNGISIYESGGRRFPHLPGKGHRMALVEQRIDWSPWKHIKKMVVRGIEAAVGGGVAYLSSGKAGGLLTLVFAKLSPEELSQLKSYTSWAIAVLVFALVDGIRSYIKLRRKG